MATQTWPSGTWASFSAGSSGTTTTMVGTPSGQYGTLTYAGNLVISGSSSSTAISELKQTSSTDTITIENGAVISGSTLDVSNLTLDGGTISYSGQVTSSKTTITLKHDNTQGNSITLPSYDFSGNVIIKGLSPADRLSITYGTISSVTDIASGEIAVTLSSGTVIDIYTAINPSTGTYFTASSFTYSGSDLTCFLSGSMIETSDGLVAVEELTIGSEIITFNNGIEILRRVTWAGHAHCTVRPYLPLDQAGYPVRILKDAVSDGVPFKDMLITAEHCLFFDGKFVPARMLVNGRSIFYDTSITSYDYYHIETEEHSVIMADGMLTESYLDTGNRSAFRQAGEVVSLTPSRNLSWEDAAASLTVDRDLVEPLFRQIETRAVHLNSPLMTDTPSLTQENDLHLVTDTGTTLRPIRKNNDRIMFMIPAGVENVRIVSNASRPCDVVGPFVDDRRMLGLLVGDVQLFEGHATKTLTSHLQDINLSGWNNVEDGLCRWTNGSALLPLGSRSIGSIALMALQVHASGPYLASDAEADLHALQA